MEKVQNEPLVNILGSRHQNYETALQAYKLERLDARRLSLCYNFAVKCTNSPKHYSMFPTNPNYRQSMRSPKQFLERLCQTSRHFNSAIPFLTRLLNTGLKSKSWGNYLLLIIVINGSWVEYPPCIELYHLIKSIYIGSGRSYCWHKDLALTNQDLVVLDPMGLWRMCLPYWWRIFPGPSLAIMPKWPRILRPRIPVAGRLPARNITTHSGVAWWSRCKRCKWTL